MYKRCLIILLACAMCLPWTQNVFSLVDNESEYSIATNEIENWPTGPDILSNTGILMDADSGEILYDKGMNEARYPASITKIMTVMIALEHSSPEEEVTFTETGLVDMWEGSNISMIAGETLTMEQCVNAIMIRSANEVANQVAEYIGGSVENFAEMMNQKAKDLGCTNTQFRNASGMPNEEHYTTAHDMALIFREALKNEDFRKIITTLYYSIPETEISGFERTMTPHHRLVLPDSPHFYEGCIGGKTGMTDASKNTLVTGVERNGTTYIAVVMRAESEQVAEDSIALFNYGFDNFEKLTIYGKEITVPKGTKEEDLTVKSEKIGNGMINKYYFNGYHLADIEVPESEIAQEPEEPVLQPETPESEKQEIITPGDLDFYANILVYIMCALVAAAIILIIIYLILRKRTRQPQN